MKLRNVVSRFKSAAMHLVLGKYASSERYINHLRCIGVAVGEGCHIYSPLSMSIDTLNPHLLSIGDNVQITANTTILTHDYSWAVIKHMTGEILGNQKETVIGNNVFIGMRSVILCGSKIGDNVVIGAGSVVSGTLASNGVYAGNPATRIMSIEDYTKKRRCKQVDEAVSVYRCYKERFHKIPDKSLFHEYFMNFEAGGYACRCI